MTKPNRRRALISVSDKSGLVPFAQQLSLLNYDILATGGTAKLLQENSITIIEVADYTGFPEIMDGRVKTLHPKIHGGLLGRRGTDDNTMAEHGISPIDLLVVNLYPFQQTIAKDDCTLEKAIENIDIGGPTMLRSAAKNHADVTVIVNPEDYSRVINELTETGNTTLATRQYLAQQTFAHTAQYDTAIAGYLQQQFSENKTSTDDSNSPSSAELPNDLHLHFQKKLELRYGENPHQASALYNSNKTLPGSLTDAKQLQGKPLSFNNLMDSDAALNCVRSLNPNQPACVIVKHATPCGVGQSDSQLTAYDKAFATDSSSAFGGIIAFNTECDAKSAEKITSQQFVEVILAPSFSTAALEILAKKKNLRVLACDEPDFTQSRYTHHSVTGGLLIQSADQKIITESDVTIASKRQPTTTEMADMLFAWHVVKYVKSNAIVYAKDQATLGIGTGQTSRVFSAKIAALKAQEANLSLTGAAMASDAFFPFADGIEVAAAAGIRSIIQPGGSIRDEEVIACADQHDIAMVFTGIRHFRH